MIKSFRKTIIVALSILLIVACGLLVGCKGCKGEPSSESKNIETIEGTITLNETSYNLKIGDAVRIVPTYDPQEGASLAYESSAPSIASVDANGEIKALTVGSAVITVKYGEIETTCNVTVGLEGELPVIKTAIKNGDSINLTLNGALDLDANVYFNNATYEDATFTYTFSKENICSVDNEVVKPLNYGTTTVTVNAEWRGITGIALTNSFTINVIADVELSVNNGTGSVLNIYSVANVNGVAESFAIEEDLIVMAIENENGTTRNLTPNIEVTSGSDLIEVGSNKVTAKGKGGVATIKISCVDSANMTHETFVTVNILKPVGIYGRTVEFSAMDGELPLTSIFGAEVTLTEAVCDGETLTLGADNKTVFGLTTSRTGAVDKTITLYTDSVGYAVNVNAYTKIIDSPEDLSVFNFANADHTSNAWDLRSALDGSFVLAADIDCTDTKLYSHGAMSNNYQAANANLSVGFIGTFDGRGHTIKNLNFSASNIDADDASLRSTWNTSKFSLFGILGANSVVKNVAITNVKFDVKVGCEPGMYSSYCATLANFVMNTAKIQDVYIDVYGVVDNGNANDTLKNWTTFSGISDRIFDGASIKNVVVDFTLGNDTIDIKKTGAICGDYTNKMSAFTLASLSDVYVISDKVLSYVNSIDGSNTEATNKFANTKRYTSFTEMAFDSANTYTTFNEENGWRKTETAVYWNGLYSAELSTVKVGEKYGPEIILTGSVGTTYDLSIYGVTPTGTPSFVVEDGTSVSIDGTTLEIVGVGSSTIKVTYKFEGKTCEITSIVTFTPPVEDYETPLVFSAMHGELPLSDIFGSDTELTLAMRGDEVLKLSADKKRVLGVTTTAKDTTETINITVYNAEKGYNLTLTAYAGIITEAKDLEVFNLGNTGYTSAGTLKAITGYYVLANNIDFDDADGYALPTHGYVETDTEVPDGYKSNVGFLGTFDGQGYTIKNVKFTSGSIEPSEKRDYWNEMNLSLFGVVGNGAVVKNFAMTNISYDLSASATLYKATCSPLGFYILSGAKVENVYVQTGSISGGNKTNQDTYMQNTQFAGLANSMQAGATVKYVVVDALNVTGFTKQGSLVSTHLGAKASDTLLSVTDVYVISATQLRDSTSQADGWGAFEATTLDGESKTETPTGGRIVEGAHRYKTADLFKEATETENFASFTDTGYWSWDATNGLVWTGKSTS